MAIKDKLKEGNIGSWVRWSLREKGIVGLLVVAMVALGIYGLFRMNKDEFPSFQIKQGLIAGIYPGATAAEVEEQLTKPLEEFLFTYKEINRNSLRSITKDGICYIYADFLLDIPQSKKDEIWSKIKLGLQTLKLTLPAGVLAVAVLDDFGNTSALLVTLESDDKSYWELEEYAEDLCKRLRAIPELAKAAILGAQEEEIAVTLDRERLSEYGIDPAVLFLDYQSSTIPIPSGAYAPQGRKERIQVKETVASEWEVANRIIYSDPSGNIVRLKDIATIERRYKTPEQFVSYNGHSCLVINVEMRPDNNIVAFGDSVEKVLKEFDRTLPTSVTLSRICDQPHVVSHSVWSFLRDLLISMLVVIFVMLMLFPMKSALIASSGVPVCTAVAVAGMYIIGVPLNTVTLAALIVCLGMIVDDSIITLDGYMNQMSKGRYGADAAASSAQELFFPTFIATLAICMMFFPCTKIIKGYLGDFVSQFPIVILLALMMSLFYAVTVVPAMEVKYILPNAPEKRKSFIAKAQDWFFDLLQRVYEVCLEWCFRHPYITIAGGITAIVSGIIMFSQINIQMLPKAERDFFVVEMYADAGLDVQSTFIRADSIAAILRKDPRVISTTCFAGTGAPRFAVTYTPILPSELTAQIIVNTISARDTEDLLREYELRCRNIFPDTQIRFKQMDYQVVESPIEVQLYGEDRMALMETSEKIASYLRSLEGETQWIHTDLDNFVPGVDIILDADEASRLGVSKALVSLSLSSTFNGEQIASLWEGDRQVPVNLYSSVKSDGAGYSAIGDHLVPTSVPGVSVPLRQVAHVQPSWNPEKLVRENGQIMVRVGCDLRCGESHKSVERKLKKFISKEIMPTLPKGVKLEYGGLSLTNDAVAPDIGWSFLAACVVLFLFLLIHFHKASIAALTMALSALCLFGASFGLWIFGLDFSITAVLGLISLVGIIVRNGILMFEYAEEAHACGETIHDAALHSGQRRMRPIFLTSCTTALGVLPMIISGDLLWMPMGVTICFGTMLTIFLITLVMPVSYWQVFKKQDLR